MNIKLLSLPLFLAMTFSVSFTYAQDKGKTRTDIFSNQYKLKNLSFNSLSSDFGLFPFSSSTFFFSSNRPNENGSSASLSHNYNNLPYLDIYMIGRSDTTFTSPVALPGKAEAQFNEGPVFFDASSSTFYITRNQYDKRKSQQSRYGTNHLKIYLENIDGTTFKSFGEFQQNSADYSVGHAALSKDGQTIYFSSDMPGGFGGSDLYKCVKEGEKWGAPKNLGAAINTTGSENFPFVSDEGKLYFSSNGHAQGVGLDIYVADYSGDNYTGAKSLGKPFNSEQDDFSFYIYSDNKTGYISSNRAGGKGDDDIYSFELSNPTIKGTVREEKGGAAVRFAKIKIMDDDLKTAEVTADSAGRFEYMASWANEYTLEARMDGFISMTKSVTTAKDKSGFEVPFSLIKEEYGMEGVVLNKDKNSPVAGVLVSLVNNTTGKTTTVNTDEKGIYHFNVKPNNEYVVKAEKVKFVTASVPVSTKGMTIGVKKQNVTIEELVVGKSIKIDNVYYDKGKWDIRADAKVELDKMAKLMSENPSMEIELSSHTDSRGSDVSNLTLSDNRAKAVAAYIVSKGVSGSRVTGKGYGETKLLNTCTNTKKCAEAEHQVNRRTEFKILKIQ
jgi:outer membrane protein OmpA-like peptidoglycan-associated protein